MIYHLNNNHITHRCAPQHQTVDLSSSQGFDLSQMIYYNFIYSCKLVSDDSCR